MGQSVIWCVVSALWMSSRLTVTAGRQVPFLADSDPDTVCAAAIHYQQTSASGDGRSESHTATSTDTAVIRVNDSSYMPGQPLLG